MNEDDGLSSLTVLVLSDLSGDDRKLTLLLTELIKRRQLIDCIFVTGSLTNGDPRQFNNTDYIAEVLVRYKVVLQTLRQISPLVYFVQGANDPVLTIKKLSSGTQAESMVLMRYPDNNEWCMDVSFQAVRLASNLVIVGSSGSSASLDSCAREAYDNGADILWSDTIKQELTDTDDQKETTPSSSSSSPTSSSTSLLQRLLNFELQVTLFDVLRSALLELNTAQPSSEAFLHNIPVTNTVQSVLKDVDPRLFYTTRTPEELRALITYKHSTMAEPFRHRHMPSGSNSCVQRQSQHPPYPFGPFFYPYVLYEGLSNFNSYTTDALTLAIQYAQSFNDYVVDTSAERDSFLTYSRRSAAWMNTHLLPQLYEPLPAKLSRLSDVSGQAARSLRPTFSSDTTTGRVNLPLHYSLDILHAHTTFHDEPMAIFIKFLLSPSLLNPTESMYMRIYGPLFCHSVDSLPGSAFQKLVASSPIEADHFVSSTAVYSDEGTDILSLATPANNAMDDMLKKEWMMKHTIVAIRDGTSHDLHDLYKETCDIVDEFSSSSDASAHSTSKYIRSMSTHYVKTLSNPSSTTASLVSSFTDEGAVSTVDSSSSAKLSFSHSPVLAPITLLAKPRSNFVSPSNVQNYSSYLKANRIKESPQSPSSCLPKSLSVLPKLGESALFKKESQTKDKGMRGWLKLAPNLYDYLPKSWTDWSNLMQCTSNELSQLYSFNASKDSVILLTHQGPAGSPTSYEFDRDKGELLETGSYGLRELHCGRLNVLLHVHGRARRPLVRLYEVDDVMVFNPGTFRDGLYGILELKRKAGIWQVSSASVHKLMAEIGSA